jgi:spore coat polysaccharide biosynthesis protein SpsF (cytidylyltransferase family)
MRVIAAVWCDLETNGLGLPSRLLAPLAGEILLLRVLRRAVRCPTFERIVLLARPKDIGRLKGLALPERCELMETEAVDVPQRAWLRRARKWSIDGWRGGIGWTSAMDEEGPPAAFWEACQRFRADALARIPSHAPFLDPTLMGDLVDQHLRRRESYQITFAQAPPGLVGEVYHPAFLERMAKGGVTPRHALMVKAGQEAMDPQRAECHMDLGGRIRNSPCRVSAESPRLWKVCESLAEEARRLGTPLDAAGALDFLDLKPDLRRGDLPREVLVDAAGGEGRLDPAVWEKGLSDLDLTGDTTVTFGVREEPLAHPGWSEFLEASRRAGAYGIHLRTSGLGLDEAAAERLMASPADIVTVQAGAEGSRVTLERLKVIQQRIGTSAPLLCAEFTLRPENEGELGAWWSEWAGRLDWLAVRGDSRSPLPLMPPDRRPCRKLSSLLYVRPDGGVLPCAEDLPGTPAIGRMDAESLSSIWKGEALASLGEAHAAGRYPEAAPPCAGCREWAWV